MTAPHLTYRAGSDLPDNFKYPILLGLKNVTDGDFSGLKNGA